MSRRPPVGPIVFAQLITRFDRNGSRDIGLPLIRQVRRHIAREMRTAGARGSLVWRLSRTPSGLTVTSYWHPERNELVRLAAAPRRLRQEAALSSGPRTNRRRLGRIAFEDLRRPRAYA
jgi:hypothetical protein